MLTTFRYIIQYVDSSMLQSTRLRIIHTSIHLSPTIGYSFRAVRHYFQNILPSIKRRAVLNTVA